MKTESHLFRHAERLSALPNAQLLNYLPRRVKKKTQKGSRENRTVDLNSFDVFIELRAFSDRQIECLVAYERIY